MPFVISPKLLNALLIPALILSTAQAQFTLPAAATTGTMARPIPEPPRDISLVEKKWEELGNHAVGKDGELALSIKPEKWKHAETPHFILHFRRFTEAGKVAREVEFDLWLVVTTLGAGLDANTRKGNVFIFEDETEWNTFLVKTNAPLWSHSFAQGNRLFLNIRQNSGTLDSHTLAHETTHTVISLLYPGESWPIWLNEGFAEYMGGACVAARNHQFLKYTQRELKQAELTLDDLFAIEKYPETTEKVTQLYQTSEKFVRFLMNEFPKDRFRQFVSEVIDSNDPKAALLKVYGDKIKDFEAFKTRFSRFTK